MIINSQLVRRMRGRWEGRENVDRFVAEIEQAHGPQQLKNIIEGDIVRRFARGDRILDAGIGTGRLSLPLVRAGLDLTGIDASAAMIERCALDPRAKSVRLVVGEIADLPFAAQTFDSVLSIDTFAHLAAWQTHLDELVRVTRSGGRIILNVGSRDHRDAVATYSKTSGVITHSSELTEARRFDVSVAELQTFAREREIALVAIVPYGAIFGTLIPNGWLTGSYAYRSGSLDRLISWIGADPRLLAFAKFFELRIVSQATPTIGSEIFAVFERRPLQRAEAERPILGTIADNNEHGAAGWQGELSAHLEYEPNRSFAVALLRAAGALRLSPAVYAQIPEILRIEMERVQRAVGIDTACAGARAAWAERSAEYLTFHGVDLSEVFADSLERGLRSHLEASL